MTIRPLSIQQAALACLLFFCTYQSINLLINGLVILGVLQAGLGVWVGRQLATSRDDSLSSDSRSYLPILVLFGSLLLLTSYYSGVANSEQHNSSLTSLSVSNISKLEVWLYPAIVCAQILLIRYSPVKTFLAISTTALLSIYQLHSQFTTFIPSAFSLLLFTVLLHLVTKHILRLEDRIQIANTKDKLTGCANTDSLVQELGKAVELAKRYDTPVSALVLTAHCQFERRDSHRTCLQEIAQICLSRLRQTDIVCRHSDKRFIILLPSTALTNAEKLKDDLLLACNAFEFSYLKHETNNKHEKLTFECKTQEYQSEKTRDQWLYELCS